MQELNDLIEISSYAGQRFDLVQAGGGNSSVKTSDNIMLIKASGFLLSEVTAEKGFSVLNLVSLNSIFSDDLVINSKSKKEREQIASILVQKAMIKGEKPSIETSFHTLLHKYVLHTHPIAINYIACRTDWLKHINDIFPDNDFLFIEYHTPGIDLAMEIKNKIKETGRIPNVTMLQNHGLIVSSNELSDIFEITEYIVHRIEEALCINLSQFKPAQKIKFLLNKKFGNNNFVYKVEDQWLNNIIYESQDLFIMPPFAPDVVVFCGNGAVEIKTINDTKSIRNYIDKFGIFPKVIIFDKGIYLIAKNIKKAKEMEEVLKFSIHVLNFNKKEKVNFLHNDEINYLFHWEAEKYRQNL